MSQQDYTTQLLGLEDAQIEKMEEEEKRIIVTFSQLQKTHHCPRCGQETMLVHDDRTRTLQDTSTAGKLLVLRYRRRRYLCPCCGKRFSESCTLAGKYQRCTRRVTMEIMD